jgi:ribosome maturation factor RimP
VERPLRGPRDFADRVGQRVRVRVEGDGGRETFTGTLVSAGDEVAAIATEAGERTVRYENVSSARLVVDWDEELKRAKKRSER